MGDQAGNGQNGTTPEGAVRVHFPQGDDLLAPGQCRFEPQGMHIPGVGRVVRLGIESDTCVFHVTLPAEAAKDWANRLRVAAGGLIVQD